jgi:hypothetical protein
MCKETTDGNAIQATQRNTKEFCILAGDIQQPAYQRARRSDDPGASASCRSDGVGYRASRRRFRQRQPRVLRDRINAELRTTFRSEFKAEISRSDVLSLEMLREYAKRSTGSKFLISRSIRRSTPDSGRYWRAKVVSH